MKPFFSAALAFLFSLLLSGCTANTIASTQHPTSDAAIATPAPAETPVPAAETPLGTTETFSWDKFTVEVSHVAATCTESRLAEGIEPYEVTIFTCYPGATLTVIGADMSDPAYSDDNIAHPQWGLYDIETDQRTKLSDDTPPIPLDDTTDFVYHLESSVAVLLFAFTA